MLQTALQQSARREQPTAASLLRNLNVTLINLLHQSLWVLALHSAAHGLARAQNLLAGARQCFGTRAWRHHARDLNDVIELQVAIVLDVLVLQSDGTSGCGACRSAITTCQTGDMAACVQLHCCAQRKQPCLEREADKVSRHGCVLLMCTLL